MLLSDVHRTRVLSHSHWFQHMTEAGRVFATTEDALEYCRQPKTHINVSHVPAVSAAEHGHGGTASSVAASGGASANSDEAATATSRLLAEPPSASVLVTPLNATSPMSASATPNYGSLANPKET
jgi:hypothetical protein